MTRTIPILFVGWFALVVSGSVSGQDAAPPELSPRDKLIVETVLRLKEFDLESSVPAKAALLRYLRAQPGTEQYFELIKRFKLVELADEVAEFALRHANESSGVRAADVLAALDRLPLLQAAWTVNTATPLEATDPAEDNQNAEATNRAVAAVSLIGYVAGDRTVELLLPVVTDSDAELAVRAAAVTALGRRPDGQQALLELVAADELPPRLHFSAANSLFAAEDASVRTEAAKYFELPATADSQPLPPIAQLILRRGDAVAGAVVFNKTGTCINCHKVRGEGKEVGPDLSEIGSKLSREAMYLSILDPSAAVSHNYETYTLLTDSGDAFSGLLISETDEAVTLRTAEGIDRKVEADAIELLKKQPQSLMPQNLQQLMTVDQLVDLVEYAMTLKK